MARIEKVTVSCDLEGSEPARTVQFAYDGQAWEIDLCERHAVEYDQAIEQLAADARVIKLSDFPGAGAAGRPRIQDGRVRRSTFDRNLSHLIRTLAVDAGEQLPTHGRMPVKIRSKYESEAKRQLEAARRRRQS